MESSDERGGSEPGFDRALRMSLGSAPRGIVPRVAGVLPPAQALLFGEGRVLEKDKEHLPQDDKGDSVIAGEFVGKCCRKELLYWWFWHSPATFTSEHLSALDEVVPRLAQALMEAVAVWMPHLELTIGTLIPDVDVHPSQSLGIPLALKKLILESVQVVIGNIDMSLIWESPNVPLPAEASFGIGSAMVFLVEHIHQVRSTTALAQPDVDISDQAPLPCDVTLDEAVNARQELFALYQRSRKKLQLLEREMKIRARTEKSFMDKMERQQAEKRMMATSELLLEKTKERSDELKRLQHAAEETAVAHKYAEVAKEEKFREVKSSEAALEKIRQEERAIQARERAAAVALIQLAEREARLVDATEQGDFLMLRKGKSILDEDAADLDSAQRLYDRIFNDRSKVYQPMLDTLQEQCAKKIKDIEWLRLKLLHVDARNQCLREGYNQRKRNRCNRSCQTGMFAELRERDHRRRSLTEAQTAGDRLEHLVNLLPKAPPG